MDQLLFASVSVACIVYLKRSQSEFCDCSGVGRIGTTCTRPKGAGDTAICPADYYGNYPLPATLTPQKNDMKDS
jgi:hypothetical protein